MKYLNKIKDMFNKPTNLSIQDLINKKNLVTSEEHFKMIKNKGVNVFYEQGFLVYNGHNSIFLGSNIYLVDTLINAGDNNGLVTIEDYVFFGHGVKVLARGHDYNLFNKERQNIITEKPIYIKEGAWIGSGAIILGGVTIGKHSVVAAGSVVKDDVPEYSVFGGNPAKLIKIINHEV